MVPSGWEIKKLEDLCTINSPITYGVVKPGDYYPNGIPLLQIKDIKHGKVLMNNLHLISPQLDEEYKRSRIQKNDILISLVGTIGRVAKYQFEARINIHRNLARIRTDFHNYLYHVLTSNLIQQRIKDVSSGSSQSALTLTTLKNFEILLPPLAEQEKIAEILSTWDQAIDFTEKLIANAELQKKALMQQLLTGKKRLLDENGERFSGKWEKVRLGDVATMNSGGTPLSSIEEYYNGDILWVSIADMTEQGKYITDSTKKLTQLGIDNSSAKIFPKNTVLYAMYASIGECSIAKKEVSTSQAILGIQPKESSLDYIYLYFYLTCIKEKVKLQGQQGTQSNLNAAMVKAFNLHLPNLKEQQKIAKVLSTADREIELLTEKLGYLKAEKRALMQQLLTGKRRVKVA